LKLKYFIIFLNLLLLPFSASATQTKLTQVNILQINQHTRLVLSFDHPFKYHCFTLKKPDRLIVDLANTKVTEQLKRIKCNSIIKNIRTGIQPHQQLRLVFSLSQRFIPKTYSIAPYGRFNYRLIIDLIPYKQISKTSTAASAKKPPIKTNIPQKKEINLRNAVIVIDPGHGGQDPGATGQLGTHEKNIVLAISKDLAALLQQQPGIEVKLTRTGDYFVPLRGRLRAARAGWADVFIAIHADAYRKLSSRGASVFALSQHGATSEAARWLAQKENHSELMGGTNLEDKSYLLRSVLIDLSQSATIRESLVLGNYIIRSLNQVARLHTGHVEQAPFVVLKSPDIPSLLIETGFISNRFEEKLLRNPKYQQKIAHAIMQGIINYLHRYPPPGTVLTILYRKTINHKVQPGENLTEIARQYKISIATLKRINHLNNNILSIGQTLQIPKR
jgi:N-acetylmuramoyl-L-alanine amidase